MVYYICGGLLIDFISLMDFKKQELKNILTACKAKEQKAQSRLYEMYFGFAKSVCLRYASNNDEAKEIMQLSFLKIFNNLDKYLDEFPFQVWIKTIIIRTALNYYRDQKKYNNSQSIDDFFEVSDQDENIIESLSAQEILQIVQKLSPSYKAAFVMYAVDGYSHKEIAEIMDITEATSRTNFMKAKVFDFKI
jgi:RNA polymerase sigma-70 factor, ECF subfamily